VRTRMIVPALSGGLALVLAALLSATTSTADPATSGEAATTSSTDGFAVAPTAPAGTGAAPAEVSERGHVRKDLGEPGGLTDGADGGVLFEISVDAARLSATCPGRGVDVSPANGHFLVLDVTASLSPDAADGADPGQDVFMPLVAEAFDVVGPGGAVQETTVTDASWACFDDDELLPPFLEPGGTVSGKVVLDSASDSGVVVYAPGGEAGWEWEFGG
jgi:hypothetical protein